MTTDTSERVIGLTCQQVADVALSTIRATIGTERYQYLSGPITGGLRLLKWHQTVGRSLSEIAYKPAREIAVIHPNIADLKAAAELERCAGRPCIEPGSFEANCAQWTQQDFLNFWERVIETHAATIRFVDGWQFSAGCAFEYICALQCQRPTVNSLGQDLTKAAALKLLDGALADLRERFELEEPCDKPIGELHDLISSRRDRIALLT